MPKDFEKIRQQFNELTKDYIINNLHVLSSFIAVKFP